MRRGPSVGDGVGVCVRACARAFLAALDERIQLGGGGTASTLERADLGIALFQVLAAPRDGDVQGFVVHVVVAQTVEIDRIINATGGVVGEVDGSFHRAHFAVTLTLPRKNDFSCAKTTKVL